MHPRLRLLLGAAAILTLAHARTVAAQSAAASELLITPAQLNKALADPNLVLLHVGPRDDYDARHIRGARYVEMSMLAADRTDGALALELPGADELRSRLERLGISDKSRVVVVPAADWGSPATRIVWTLQVAGLGRQTQLLEGGTTAWQGAGLPLTAELPPPPTPGKLTVAPDRSLVVDHAWVQARLTQPDFHLIDARAPVFYSGPGMKMRDGTQHDAGHIPGAHNIPFNTLFNDSLQFIPRKDIEAAFAAAGVKRGDTVVAYCHVGQQATMVLFAARLLGHPVKLYDGSFEDWDRRKLPVEKTPSPSPSHDAREE